MTSSRCRGEYPQTVDGRTISVREPGRALLHQHVFAHRLVLRVVCQRLERQILMDIRLRFDTVHAGRRCIDESLDAAVLGQLHQFDERVVIDRLAKLRVEFEARIVGDAGEVNDRVAAGNRFVQRLAISQVAPDLLQISVAPDGVKHVLAVQVKVENLNSVAFAQKRRNQAGADIACAPGHEHRPQAVLGHTFGGQRPSRRRSAILWRMNWWPISTMP